MLRGKAIGFTLAEIRELLALSESARADVAGIEAIARFKLDEIEVRLSSLARVHDGLKAPVDACPGNGPITRCPIRAALLEGRDLHG